MSFRSPRALYNTIYKQYHENRVHASNDITELPAVLKLLGDIRGKRVLDLGCGLGKHSKAFSKRGAIVTGIDVSENMLDICKKTCCTKGTFIRSSYEEVNFPAESFDIVNASLSIHYSNKLDKVFNNINKWLVPGGIFTFSVAHPLWYYSRIPEMEFTKPKKVWFYMTSYKLELYNYYKPLSYYIDLFNSHNFKFVKLIETVVPRRYKGWSEDRYRVPGSMVFKLEKI
ncbi:class I SAM-dependent methyltransferase [Candidatus Roizmanbacteria bacterium]|nr:class I SAM-dependent methyltransferase [Candidatus Roizmanbacteria bacterium]